MSDGGSNTIFLIMILAECNAPIHTADVDMTKKQFRRVGGVYWG